MATAAKPESKQVDRLEQEGAAWYERNVEDVKRCTYAKDVARLAFEAGWRAAFEVVLDQRRSEV